MNWGAKITVLYLAFVAMILVLMFTCFGHPTELEYKDYYAREIKYQDQIDASTNANNLTAPIEYELQKSTIQISVPNELLGADLQGKITLLRPSDSKFDCSFELALNQEGKQSITDSSLPKGVYKLGISLKKGSKSYYKEGVINLK